MTISFIGIGTNAVNNTNGATLTFPWPSGYTPVAGDMVIVAVVGNGTAATAAPTPTISGNNMTQRGLTSWSNTPNLVQTVFYKFLVGGESAPQLVVNANYGGATLGLGGYTIVYRGVHNSTVFDRAAIKTNGSAAAATFSGGTLTTVANNVMVIQQVSSDDNNALSLTTANGWTARGSGASYSTSSGGKFASGFADIFTATGGTVVSNNTWTETINGNDSWSAWSDALFPAAVPGTPTALSGVNNGTNGFALSWTPPADNGQTITDYIVEWSYKGQNSFTAWSHGALGAASGCTVTGLQYQYSYDFRIKATNAIGNSASYSSSSTTSGKSRGVWGIDMSGRAKL